MLKRIFILLTIFIALFSYLQINNAEAADYYLGEYANGQSVYLMTDSVREYQITRNGYWVNDKYECTAKAVYPNSDKFEYVSYEVLFSTGPLTYSVSKNGSNLFDRKTVRDFLKNNPVERNLIKYISNLRKNAGKGY